MAERYQREALLALRSTGDELGVATALDNLAGLRLLADDREGARVLAEESLAVSRRLGALSNVACALVRVGQAVRATDAERAQTALAEALSLSQSLSEQEGIAAALEAFAAWWLPLEPTRAATLLGAAGAIRARSGAELDAGERRALERVGHDGVKAVPRVEWEAALARGLELDVDAAVTIALEPTQRVPAAVGASVD